MGFSETLLLAAIASGAVVVLAASRGRDPRDGTRRAVFAAVGVCALHGAAAAIADLGLFAQVHVVYVLGTVMPTVVVGGLVLLRSTRRWLGRWRGKAAIGVLLLPGAIGVYATHIEPDRLRVDRVELASEAGSLRIGVLADLQTPNIGDHERAAVARLLAEEPDLILIPGDLWQMSDEQIERDWPQFADLVAEMVAAVGTVVLVEGDTDHIGWLDRIGAETGALVAHNRVVEIEIDGVSVLVGGTQLVGDDPSSEATATMVELARRDQPGVITIALSHRPDVVEWLPGAVDILVTGHTHGGQVSLPFVGPLITLSAVPRDVAAGGLHVLDGQAIYVSTGVGLERKQAPQIRFGVVPSVGLIELRSTD